MNDEKIVPERHREKDWMTVRRIGPTKGQIRNKPCFCGSGKKAKSCCLKPKTLVGD